MVSILYIYQLIIGLDIKVSYGKNGIHELQEY